MANPIKGEIGFTAGALGSFVLVYDFNALVTMEEELGVPVGEIPAMFTAGVSAKTIRSVFRVGLEAHHPEVGDKVAGAIIHEIGAPTAADLIGKAFAAAFPEAKAGKAKASPKGAGTSPTS